MTYGGPDTARSLTSVVRWISIAAESIGLLNKGSAKTPAAPTASDVADVQPVSSNTLNVTRVGGITTLIAAAGGAALLIFNVDKTKDRASIVVAAYVSIGVIVGAALFTVAIIIAADIRARSAIATAVSPKVRSERVDVKYIAAVAAAAAGGPPPDFTASLDQTYNYVLVNANAANVILTLPGAGSFSWQQMTIKRADDDAQKTVTIQPQGQETVLGQHTHSLPPANSIHIYSNGAECLAVQ